MEASCRPLWCRRPGSREHDRAGDAADLLLDLTLAEVADSDCKGLLLGKLNTLRRVDADELALSV